MIEAMRVAMISMHTSPLEQPGTGDAGGLNVYVHQSAIALAKQGVEVDVFTRATRPSQGEIVEVVPGYRVINIIAGPFDGLAKEELPTQLAAFAGGIITWARCHNQSYDLIHSHYWLAGQVGWLLHDLWQLPVVHTAHTLAAVKNLAHHQATGSASKPEGEARRICEQQIVDNVTCCVVNTSEEQQDLLTHYDANTKKIAIIPPGADVDLYTPGTDRATEKARRELGIPLHSKVIAFVGRLQEFKGINVLLEAASLMAQQGEQFRIIVCGGASGAGNDTAAYQKLCRKLGIAHLVRFLAPRPPADLVAIYRAADIVAVPSYNESFGLVAIEAQAAGTPVVASHAGGLPIAVKDGQTGKLVPDHNPASWAAALTALLADDDTRIKQGQLATIHAQNFSWQRTATLLAQLYQRLIATPILPCTETRDARG